MSRFTGRSRGEWLGLGEASRLLGVTPGTLRRWSDRGDVTAFTTPGGHRRYRRATLERLLPANHSARPLLSHTAMSPARLARAYRVQARSAARQLAWVLELNDEQRGWFRRHGRVLAEAVLAHLDSTTPETSRLSLEKATAEAAEYGRMALQLGVSLSEAVEGFLEFRRPFLHQLGLFARRRELDATRTSELMEAAERAMDRLLIAAMAAHGVEHLVASRNHRAAGEGLA